MKKYLLPCPCGRSVEVDANQAGLQTTCECGQALEVPTMLGLAQLEPATSSAAAPTEQATSQWGPAQGLLFLGGLLLLIGLAALAFIYPQRPHVMIDTALIQQHLDHMTPEET